MKKVNKQLNLQNNKIHLSIYLPDEPLEAIIQLNHGLAEHGGRYEQLASFFCSKGYAVYIHDHPGHGQSITSREQMGHIPWSKGWDLMLDAIHAVNKSIRKKYPQIPVFLMGHSMGSLLARYYNATYPMYFKGMIISGTSHPTPFSLNIGISAIRLIALFLNSSKKPGWLNRMFYNRFNNAITNPNTPFDWLSSDSREVEKYIQDHFCGFDMSLAFYKNLLQGSLQLFKSEKHLRFRKNFATLIISGKHDPVGKMGKEPQYLEQKYKSQGFFNTHLHLLDGRHELFNEKHPIKVEATQLVAHWISEKLKGSF